MIIIKVDNGRVKDPVFRCCCWALFAWKLAFFYGERTSCATYYQKGGASAVLENPVCSSWVLYNNFFRNHRVNCLLAGFKNFEDREKHFKEIFFVIFICRFHFWVLCDFLTNCTWFSVQYLACFKLMSSFWFLKKKKKKNRIEWLDSQYFDTCKAWILLDLTHLFTRTPS